MSELTRGIEVFTAVVEAGNFTSAAAQRGLTPAGVSRAIATLEERLGVQLLRRTTRTMRLTDEGRAYFERCREALAILGAAETSLSHTQVAPRGRVRMSAPTTYAHHRILPVAADLATRFPELSLEVHVSDRNVDIVAEGYDLAVRMGELDDSSLVAHKLEDAALGVFASPDHLARRGAPRSPADLDRHELIGFVRPSTGRLLPWLFHERDGSWFEIAPRSRLRVTGDPLAAISLSRAGGGLVQTYRSLVEEDLARGLLVEVLQPFAGRSRPFSLLRPAGRAPSLAVRTVADAIVAGHSAGPARARKPGRES